MTEYQCGNCREISRLGPSARFCPYCGSTSLLLRIREEAGPSDMEVAEGLVKAAFTLGKEVAKAESRPSEVEKPRRRKQASE